MEINPSGLGNSEHLIILGDDFAQNLETKSFCCSFCKRGFSNAQALGGHMNIHRKDRAKLLELSDENLLSLEISRGVDSDDSLPMDSVVREKLSVENDQIHDRADNNIVDYGEGIPPRQLPLFSEAAAVSRKVELKCGELDLELRLGPEPPHHHHAKSKPLD